MKISFIVVVFTSISFCLKAQSNRDAKVSSHGIIEPIRVRVPKSEVAASGKYVKVRSGKDSIEQSVIIPLQKPEVRKLPMFTDASGKAMIDSKGNEIIMGDFGGYSAMTVYTTDDGLALDGIYCGRADHFGNLWFGTSGGGISRFDGQSFVNYTTLHGLANNTVICITEDLSGKMWFGTAGGGVCCYNGQTFAQYTKANGLPDDYVRSMFADSRGNIWFGTVGQGVSCYNGKQFINYTKADGLPNNSISCIAEDKSGNIWFGTNGSGISKFDGKNFTNFSTIDGLAHDVVSCMAFDPLGRVWIGTIIGGLSCYDGVSFKNYNVRQGLVNDRVTCLKPDNNGNLWIGTVGGVSCFIGDNFKNYTTDQGLPNNIVNSILQDKSGSLWFGTYGGGVCRYDGPAFVNFSSKQGLANDLVWTINEDIEGNIWLGTHGDGVSKFDGKTFTNYSVAQGLAGSVVWCILTEKSGNLWFGTSGGGISNFDGKVFTNYSTDEGLAHNRVRCLWEDASGNLWIGTSGGGVSKFNGHNFVNYTTEDGMAGNIVFSICEDSFGNLWLGTYGGGVSCFDGQKFQNYTSDHGLTSNVVYNISKDNQGNLWFGTDGGGVSCLTLNVQKDLFAESPLKQPIHNSKLFENYSTVDGLPDNVVTQVIDGGNGILYVGTNFGICELIPAKEGVKRFRVGAIYNTAKGYPVKDVNARQNAMFKDSKGIIWIATGSDKTALVRFDASELHKDYSPPEVLIKNIKITEENICWHSIAKEMDSVTMLCQELITLGKKYTKEERNHLIEQFNGIRFQGISDYFPVPQNLILSYDHNHLTFEFGSRELVNSEMIRYQYFLEGYDKKWGPVTQKSSATFGNIDEGTYVFKLRARSPLGVWSKPISFKFRVLPPWYRSWWMKALYLLTAVTVVWAIVKLNGQRLRMRAKELQQEVRKATAEIRSQKELVEEQKQNIEEKHKEITDSIRYAKRIQEAILPSMTSMVAALRDGFVLYEPKDVVAGDFYWMEKYAKRAEKNLKEIASGQNSEREVVYFAAADCTGHGVPGALVSVVCSNALSKALMEEHNTETGKLLDRTREIVIERLAKSTDVKDGMDISLCAIDFEALTLQWSGANNPLWLFRQNTLIEIKHDKQPIGYFENSSPFTTHFLQLLSGDVLYIFTDGYQDQFGGEKGKKFKISKMKERLMSICDYPMPRQKVILEQTFEKWRGSIEQVDDVCFIGVRIG